MATNLPFPYLPSRSTALLFESFDPAVFTKKTDSVLYNFLDALVGTTGAGNLLNQAFMANLNAALETCYFNELDYIVGNINFMARTTAESYEWNPMQDQLTSDQWDEVRIKDAWFRSRIKDFFAACQLGGTPEGIRKAVSAAVATDCTIQEVWRYVENFFYVNGGETLGRTEANPESQNSNHYSVVNLKTGHEVVFSGSNALTAANQFKASQSPSSDWERRTIRPRNEVVIRPHKATLLPEEMRLLREILNRIMPIETVITVNTKGLSVSTPVSVAGATSDSCYYEVVKQVIPSPLIAQLPAPEFLPIDLLPGEQWLLKKRQTRGRFSSVIEQQSKNPAKREAPYAAFMQTAQYSDYYLAGSGKSSPIDSITYGTLESDGSIKPELNYRTYQQNSSYTGWMNYELADSPDNYPGGKYGINPTSSSSVSSTPRRHKLFTWSGTSVGDKMLYQAMLGKGVDQGIWEWVPVAYPHWIPINPSVAEGVASGIAAIKAWPGKFALAGYSQGGIVASNILWHLKFGELQDRYDDLIGGVTFGNPCREAGHTFPGGIDPGGAGMAPDSGNINGRIRNTPDYWYDFANSPKIPGVIGTDNFAVNPLDSRGIDITAAYQVMLAEFTGADYDPIPRIKQLLGPERTEAIRDAIGAITYTITGTFAGHAQYSWSRPLPGSKLTSVELGIKHLNEVGSAHPLYITSGSAFNPDGTDYIFPYDSQKSYVKEMMAKINAMGGIANETHYKLPIQKEQTIVYTYYPEYAVANFPPTKESTVSASITRQRPRVFGRNMGDTSKSVR